MFERFIIGDIRCEIHIFSMSFRFYGQFYKLFNFYLTVTICPKLSTIPLACAIKMAATASYKAVPSILIVAPIGSTNLCKQELFFTKE